MKKRKFQKSENKSKRKKGTLVGNTILLVAIAVLVVSMLFTLCAKIVDKNDAKEELSSASDELLTLASEEESDSLTEAPTTEAVLPTEWAFYANGHTKEVEDEYDCYDRYLLYDGEVLGVATVASEHREERSGATSPFHKFQVMYCFQEGYTVTIEAPTDCRVAFTGADPDIGTLMLYECFDLPAGVHTLDYPDWVDIDYVNVVVFYEK